MKLHTATSLAILLSTSLCPANWPGWRGAEGTGVTSEKNLPEKWSVKENVKWRVDLPERSNSSPIVWGDKVFVTQALSGEKKRTLMCFNRADGKQLWQSGVAYPDNEQTQRDNPYCSATPVTDGERVIVSFGSAGLYCYDFAGKEVWHRDFGKMNHIFGNGSSPMLAGNACVLNFGPDEKARLIAVDKTTGKTIWEVEPPKIEPAELAAMRGSGGGGRGQGGGGGGGGGNNNNGSIGARLAAQIVAQADKDADKKVSDAEFNALPDAWYDKLDAEKTGKVSVERMSEKWYDAVPPLEGGDAGGASRGPSRTTAPAIFTASDADKDGSLTREELKGAFTKWFTAWDTDKTGSIAQDAIAQGLDSAMGQPQGGGERGGGGGGGRGFGGGRGAFGGATWATPILIKAGDRDELVMGFPGRLAAYDPKTGTQLWMSKGIGSSIYTTPVWGEGVLFASTSGQGGGPAVAVKPGGSGDVSESQRVWKLDRYRGAVGSGVIYGGHLFTIGSDGFAECRDLKSGDSVWDERLPGTTSRGSSWSSMLLAGDKIYLPNQAGDVFVLRAGPKFEIIATNATGESTNSSLAADNGELFMRTDKGLWCIAQAK